MRLILIFCFTCYTCICHLFSQQHNFQIDGLKERVEIITDVWGVPHIYAQNEEDLFFAQGWYAAKDRLFQFEIWRRQATGTVAEILGERELNRDIGTRLFKFRGDMDAEMNHYHPKGKSIITSYVRGVNAYIKYINDNPEKLPIEFRLMGIRPHPWTTDVVISRHQGLLGNISQELTVARAVATIGEEKVKEVHWFHPKEPNLSIDESIRHELLFDNILDIYNAYRRPIEFRPEDLISSVRNDPESYYDVAQSDRNEYDFLMKEEVNSIGSNNWVVSGELTESGFPIMANDPHRRQSTPSLRYMAHLVAPGWNVIGGGEPEIPGISIGHNEKGAWGLTVYRTDAEDLYVYRLNPENHNQYWHKNRWHTMELVNDTIPVKDSRPSMVTHRYTLHGPVTMIDEQNHVAYAVRCGWLEIGGSPYLASLRMDQANNFDEFREACNYSNIPGENMVWADRAGNIGWQAVGIAPIRRGWSGMVPVPGDGSHEWDGYLPIISKPFLYNPKSGYINTSNENVTPQSYELWDAVGFSWSDPFRGDRVEEVLSDGHQLSMMDMMQLQTDYVSIPARQLIPLLEYLEFERSADRQAQNYLLDWDHDMHSQSIAAAIYAEWEGVLRADTKKFIVPQEALAHTTVSLKKVIEWLLLPDGRFGKDPLFARDELIKSALSKAVDQLAVRLGDVIEQWHYGQEANKHVTLKHPLSNAVNQETRRVLDVGPAPRGGNSFTVNNTSSSLNQSSGGSFRMIVDTGDWDNCVATNTPGQNGDPSHPHYRNLFDSWSKDKYFPLFYSRQKVESVSSEVWILNPR